MVQYRVFVLAISLHIYADLWFLLEWEQSIIHSYHTSPRKFHLWLVTAKSPHSTGFDIYKSGQQKANQRWGSHECGNGRGRVGRGVASCPASYSPEILFLWQDLRKGVTRSQKIIFELCMILDCKIQLTEGSQINCKLVKTVVLGPSSGNSGTNM